MDQDCDSVVMIGDQVGPENDYKMMGKMSLVKV